MPLYINTNSASLGAQRSLTTANNALQTSLQRLSSGQRINTAKDDAAGMGITNRMTTQITGLNQAARNAGDGISLAQVTEGALGEVTTNLQRVRELAVQSANATNSAGDRAVLDQEVQLRFAEIDRIASQTNFNGQKVLDGTFGTSTFQVGANAGETISVNLSQSVKSSVLGKVSDSVGNVAYNGALNVGQQGAAVDATAMTAGEMRIAIGTGAAVSITGSAAYAGSATGQGSASAFAKAAAINASGVGSLTATADTTSQYTYVATTAVGYTLSINGQAITTAGTTALSGSDWATMVNGYTGSTGVTATFDSVNGRMTLQAADGRDIAISQSGTGTDVGKGLTAKSGTNNSSNTATALTTVSGTPVAVTDRGSIRLTSSSAVTVSGTTPARIGYNAATQALGTSTLSSSSVTTLANANSMITNVDAALNQVAALRGQMGAVQSRMEATISSILVNSENLQSSRSRILDTDYAAETANLTKAQVMQQASTAILSQANAAPQSVLSLLR
ncbi:MAG: flagellin [Proteobacteria bacterium]|nr:flagellin [Pseudomonadota bacterium]